MLRHLNDIYWNLKVLIKPTDKAHNKEIKMMKVVLLIGAMFLVSCASQSKWHSQHQEYVQNDKLEKQSFYRGIASEDSEYTEVDERN